MTITFIRFGTFHKALKKCFAEEQIKDRDNKEEKVLAKYIFKRGKE